jgi:hypothetical protein
VTTNEDLLEYARQAESGIIACNADKDRIAAFRLSSEEQPEEKSFIAKLFGN